jgi:flagellar motor switch protein FliN
VADQPIGGQSGNPAGTALAQQNNEAVKELERILEIPLQLHVELGSKKMRVKELLDISAGALLELDTEAGAQLEIFANDILIAQGEAVVVGERYGVRITEIISFNERLSRISQQKRGL